ncbi:2TM domain-containing protein [Aureibaculum algae]|uniref:2TM domain-containing protein n=1 Tax=Aureibaculum algae TaxID=2584122 RepID=A0A5B7TSE5_9FLAO|nr:2TM domain-containing protein [Aureibaculum algae]QCX39250.1 2TM domain-containing protein [Aureibaculum algae]
MESEHRNNRKYRQAKQRVKELKGFYWHFAIYMLVNLFLTVNKVIRNYYNGESLNEAIWNFDTFSVWFFWGIGIFFHGMNVFGYPLILGKNWEEGKIKKIMEEDERQIRKYK